MKTVSQNFILKSAFKITLALIAYFHFVELLGFAHIIELRFLNGLILYGGIYYFVKQMKENNKGNFHYIDGLATGFFIGLANALMFAAYMSLYLFIINPSFFAEIKMQEQWAQGLRPFMVPIIILIEASASSYLFSYASMQFLKVDRYTEPSSH